MAENRATFSLRRRFSLGFSKCRWPRTTRNVPSRSTFFFSRRNARSTGSPFFSLISVNALTSFPGRDKNTLIYCFNGPAGSKMNEKSTVSASDVNEQKSPIPDQSANCGRKPLREPLPDCVEGINRGPGESPGHKRQSLRRTGSGRKLLKRRPERRA